MSNLMEVIKSRRSTRAFKSELPPKDQIMQIVEAAADGYRARPRLLLDQPAARDLRRARSSCTVDRVRRTGGPHRCLLRCNRLHREGNAGKAAS